jgi:hypothetical protein
VDPGRQAIRGICRVFNLIHRYHLTPHKYFVICHRLWSKVWSYCRKQKNRLWIIKIKVNNSCNIYVDDTPGHIY